MDKQATAKFELLLQGLVSRITDEFDFFVGLTGEFSAGTKKRYCSHANRNK